jgi:hypothetical protein
MTMHRWAVCGLTIIAALLPLARAQAQVGGPYDLSWNAIDCGGGSSAGGALGVYVSIGQPDIGASSGGVYTIEGGFDQQGLAPAGLDTPGIPVAFGLDPARPNPTSTNAIISFGLPDESHVRLQVFSADGSLVRELADEALPAGQHAMYWDGRDSNNRPAAGGVYFIRLESRDRIRTQKLVIAR